MTTARAERPAKVDALSPEVLEDPYPEYRRLRNSGRLASGGPGRWVAVRHRDVSRLLRDPRLSSEFPAQYHEYSLGVGAASTFLSRIILTRDPPAHTRLRRLMGTAFGASAVRALREHVAELVDQLMAPALERGSVDMAAEVAFPLPAMVVCRLLGVPASDRAEVWPKAAELAKALGTIAPTAADVQASEEALAWLRDYIRDLLAWRRRAPADDQLSRMLSSEGDAGTLSPEDIVDNAVFLFFAGFETTMGLISNGCAALSCRPEQVRRLRADPSLVPVAVEECLRYDPPIQWVARLAVAPITVADTVIRPHRTVMLLLGSANRDEEQFPDPADFDVSRQPNAHLAFGGGIHHCLGAILARMEWQVLLEWLLLRCREWEPAGVPVRRQHPSIRCHASVPLTLRVR